MRQPCKVGFIFLAEAFALVVGVGCGDQQSGGAIVAPVSTASLATMLAEGARLNRSGEIQVAGPVATWLPQITLGRADSLAQGWVRAFASRDRSLLERQRSAPIYVPALRVCGRTFFARSAFDPLPSTLPAYIQRSFGPYWMVTLCDGQAPAVSLAVSAYATELTLANGEVRFPIPSIGEDFKWMGIPVGSPGLPLPPEEAVATMFAQIRRRVAAAPELVIPGNSIPQLARWHLRLDSTASFRTENGIVREQDVYVGKLRAGDTVLARLAPAQPDSITFHWFSPPQHWTGPGGLRVMKYPASAMRAAGMPMVFEAVFGVLAPSKKH